jgi:hypothetical protein
MLTGTLLKSAALHPASYYQADGEKWRHGRSPTPRKKQTQRREPKMAVCLIGCPRPEYSRGLCNSCYQSALRLVKEGETTWEKLEELGFAKKAQRVDKRGTLLRKFKAATEITSLGMPPAAAEPTAGPLGQKVADAVQSTHEGTSAADHPDVVFGRSAATPTSANMKEVTEGILNDIDNTQFLPPITKDYGDPEVNVMITARLPPVDPRSETHQAPHPDDVQVDTSIAPWLR